MTNKNKKPAGYAINVEGNTVALARTLDEAMDIAGMELEAGFEKVEIEAMTTNWQYIARYASFEDFDDEWVNEIILAEARRLQSEKE